MDALMLDGNAVAGLLQEVFETEMTTVTGTCAFCGTSMQLGAVHVFRSAGVVLRCPTCGNVLAKIVKRETEACVDLTGLRALA
jgi:ribosomal protein S27E